MEDDEEITRHRENAGHSIQMLRSVVDSATYEAVALQFGISRTAVERRIKSIAVQLTQEVGVDGLKEEGAAFVPPACAGTRSWWRWTSSPPPLPVSDRPGCFRRRRWPRAQPASRGAHPHLARPVAVRCCSRPVCARSGCAAGGSRLRPRRRERLPGVGAAGGRGVQRQVSPALLHQQQAGRGAGRVLSGTVQRWTRPWNAGPLPGTGSRQSVVPRPGG
jgi:hypothetical protein